MAIKTTLIHAVTFMTRFRMQSSSSAFQLNVHNNVPVMPAKAGIQKQSKKPGFQLALE